MTLDASRSAAQRAGEALTRLLSQREEYRKHWTRFQHRGQGTELNQAAIARVITLHLWDVGERSDSDLTLARTLKDRIRRCLAGEVVSAETLNWFIDAFQMTAEDADQLRAVRFGVITGLEPQPVINSLRNPLYLPFPQQHRTISVFEHRTIGPGGHAVAHHTTRAIMACEDGVSSYPYRLVPGATNVRVQRGGNAIEIHEFNGSTPIVEIKLTRPLHTGEVASLEYSVDFDAHELSTEYRRVAHARTGNLDIVVKFSPSRPPRQLWWAVWDNYRDGVVVHEEAVTLDTEGSVHRFLPYLENAAVGFHWTW
jgi:hypothetical protein